MQISKYLEISKYELCWGYSQLHFDVINSQFKLNYDSILSYLNFILEELLCKLANIYKFRYMNFVEDILDDILMWLLIEICRNLIEIGPDCNCNGQTFTCHHLANLNESHSKLRH